MARFSTPILAGGGATTCMPSTRRVHAAYREQNQQHIKDVEQGPRKLFRKQEEPASGDDAQNVVAQKDRQQQKTAPLYADPVSALTGHVQQSANVSSSATSNNNNPGGTCERGGVGCL